MNQMIAASRIESPAGNLGRVGELPHMTEVLLDMVGSGQNFSDLHFEESAPAMIRMPSGWEQYPDAGIMCREDLIDFARFCVPDWSGDTDGATAAAIELQTCRLRVNIYTTHAGSSISINVRHQPLTPVPFQALGLPDYVRKLAELPSGLVLVTGQTGSGKTTTLAALIDYVNQTRAAHVVTIEDPVEFVHKRKKSIFSHKEVGADVPSFAVGLYDALRQKPDVIMVGEIRDRETAEVALEAAESGHLVLASMHTSSVHGAINKLMSWSGDTRQRSRMLSESLQCVICQKLVASADGSKRVMAHEILMAQEGSLPDNLRDPDRHSRVIQEALESDAAARSHSLNADLKRLFRAGAIKQSEALRASNNPRDLLTLLGQAN